MAPFIYEFLYRGRADGSSAYHVLIGNAVDDGIGGQSFATKGPLTPAQADAAGFPLTVIFEHINQQALADLDAANAALDAANQQVSAVTQERENANAALAQCEADFAAYRDAHPAAEPEA